MNAIAGDKRNRATSLRYQNQDRRSGPCRTRETGWALGPTQPGTTGNGWLSRGRGPVRRVRCWFGRRRLQTWQSKVQRRLLQAFGPDAAGGAPGQLNQKSQQWWTLSLNELGQALKTSFKLRANPFQDPRMADQWEPYLAENRQAVERLTRSLADAEADLNDRVYTLFHLTPDEIQLLQREVEH